MSDASKVGSDGLRLLENIGVRLTVEVGRAELTIRDLLRLSEGSVIELDRLAGDPLDVLVNGTLIAKGEVVCRRTTFGIRFADHRPREAGGKRLTRLCRMLCRKLYRKLSARSGRCVRNCARNGQPAKPPGRCPVGQDEAGPQVVRRRSGGHIGVRRKGGCHADAQQVL